MNRRDTLLAILALGTAPLAARAQQQRRVRRIGVLILASAKASADWMTGFRDGMAALHWIEGRDYVIDLRYGNGIAQAGPNLAAELVASQPDLLLTGADEAVQQLSQRTKTIPIVFAIAHDPVGTGLAASLQRPGGNATGLTTLARDLWAKRLQLLKEAFPRVTHVVLLSDPADAGSVSQEKDAKEAAEVLKIRLSRIELRQAADIEAAFTRGAALGAQAYILATGFLFSSHVQAIVDRTIRARVPAFVGTTSFVEAGGLMSYSPSYPDNFRRAAAYVDKILKGEKPGDLPIEQPIKFELALNLKTAKAIGVKFPQSILLRADRVIE